MQDFVEEPHSHSKDEIIVVVAGSLLLGPNRYGPGTALAIDADTVYSFAVKEEALHFMNFRAGASFVTTVTRNGKLPPRSERDFITSLPTSASWNAVSNLRSGPAIGARKLRLLKPDLRSSVAV